MAVGWGWAVGRNSSVAGASQSYRVLTARGLGWGLARSLAALRGDREKRCCPPLVQGYLTDEMHSEVSNSHKPSILGVVENWVK